MYVLYTDDSILARPHKDNIGQKFSIFKIKISKSQSKEIFRIY